MYFKRAIKIGIICSICYLSTPANAQDVNAQQFFNNTTTLTDNNLTIAGTYTQPDRQHLTFTNFGAHNTLNLNISNQIFKRSNTGSYRIGITEADKSKTININIAQNYAGGSVFDLANSNYGGGNIYAMSIGTKFGVNNAYQGSDLTIFDINANRFTATADNFGSWPIQVNLSFGSDVIAKNISGSNKFISLRPMTNGSNAVGSVFLNHRGGFNHTNANQNYYGDNINISWAGKAVSSRIYMDNGGRLSNNAFPDFTNSTLNNLLQISGDIVIDAQTGFSGATGPGAQTPNGEQTRIYANFVNTNTDISHYYGDMSGNGKMFINFIGADFKGNNNLSIGADGREISGSTGSITGAGERHMTFMYRSGTQTPRSQFDVNIESSNANNTFHIDNFGGSVVIDGNGATAHVTTDLNKPQTIANLAATGLNFGTNPQGIFTFTRNSYVVNGGGAITGLTYGVFGNDVYAAETDKYGNTIATNPNYADNVKSDDRIRTLRYAGSNLPEMVSDVDIGTTGDTEKKEIYFVFKSGTFGNLDDYNSTKLNGGYGYLGTIRGGTADSIYYFRNAGYVNYSSVSSALGKVVLDTGSAYREQIIGNNDTPINIALNLSANNPVKQQGRIVGSNTARHIELSFTGMRNHTDLKLSISGSGYGANANNGYYISNLKNVSTTMAAGKITGNTALTYTNSILGVLGNAGIAFNENIKPTTPTDFDTFTTYTDAAGTATTTKFQLTGGTDISPISIESKFQFRGSSISGDLNSTDYQFDIVFDNTDSDKGTNVFKNPIEKSQYVGNEINLSGNNRDHKLHFIGKDSIKASTKDRVRLLLGTGNNDIALIDTQDTLVEMDASRSTGKFNIHNANLINNTGADSILPISGADINISNTTLTLNSPAPVGINAVDNNISIINNVNIYATGITSAKAMRIEDRNISLSGKINISATTNPLNAIAIEHNQTTGTNTINNFGEIDAGTAISANVAKDATLNINNTGIIATTGKELKFTGEGNIVLGEYHTTLHDFTTNVLSFNPNDNTGKHSIEMSPTNSLQFKDKLLFRRMDSIQGFYLQDMVAIDGNNTSASWNDNPTTNVAGQVSASNNLQILGPINMFAFFLDRDTGLVNVVVDPRLSPTTTMNKILLGNLESMSDKLASDVGTLMFAQSRNRYIDKSQEDWEPNKRTMRLKAALQENRENRDLTRAGRLSYRVFVGTKPVNLHNPINYLLYERNDRVEMYINPYYVRSTLNDKSLYGNLSGYGISGGATLNVFRDLILGWNMGMESKSGDNGGLKTEIINKYQSLGLNIGIHGRYNAFYYDTNKLVYFRGSGMYQYIDAKQNTTINTGNDIRLMSKTTALRLDALLGVETNLKSGDIVAFELGASKYDVNFDDLKLQTGQRDSFDVKARTQSNIYLLGNLRWARTYKNQFVYMTPNASLGLKALLTNDNFDIPIIFGWLEFDPKARLNRVAAVLDVGADMLMLNKQLTLGLRYVGEYGQYMFNHVLQGKVGYRF